MASIRLQIKLPKLGTLFVGAMTILPGLGWTYSFLGGSDKLAQIWLYSMVVVIFVFMGFAYYCSNSQKLMQQEINRISKQRETLEKTLLKRRVSSQKGGTNG